MELFHQKRTIRYWIGTGGCVLVVALLISWTLRDDSGSKEAKARNLAALAIGLLIAVYLYAHTVLSLEMTDVATEIYAITTDDDIGFSGEFGTE